VGQCGFTVGNGIDDDAVNLSFFVILNHAENHGDRFAVGTLELAADVVTFCEIKFEQSGGNKSACLRF
jgi:hypothetical protein